MDRYEQHIEDEQKELFAEGKRRQREYEGIPPPSEWPLSKSGVRGVITTHKLPSAEDVESFWVDGIPAITTYTPTTSDLEGLAQEVEDLDRDADLMRKYMEVEYPE